MKLRGQEVLRCGKTLYLTIKKPYGNTFSISDKLKSYINRGYTLCVKIPHKEVYITQETPFLRKEVVPSKFEGSDPWHRYWYKTNVGEQKELF